MYCEMMQILIALLINFRDRERIVIRQYLERTLETTFFKIGMSSIQFQAVSIVSRCRVALHMCSMMFALAELSTGTLYRRLYCVLWIGFGGWYVWQCRGVR